MAVVRTFYSVLSITSLVVLCVSNREDIPLTAQEWRLWCPRHNFLNGTWIFLIFPWMISLATRIQFTPLQIHHIIVLLCHFKSLMWIFNVDISVRFLLTNVYNQIKKVNRTKFWYLSCYKFRLARAKTRSKMNTKT
jgi:hypothetical protein